MLGKLLIWQRGLLPFLQVLSLVFRLQNDISEGAYVCQRSRSFCWLLGRNNCVLNLEKLMFWTLLKQIEGKGSQSVALEECLLCQDRHLSHCV